MDYDKTDSSMKIIYDYYDFISENRSNEGIAKTQVYTPPEIAEFIVKSSIDTQVANFRERGQPLLEIQVMDPCCGSGIFLLYAVRRLHKLTGLPKRDIIENCIHGIDIDIGAVNATKRMLQNEAEIKNKKNLKTKIWWGDALLDFFLKADTHADVEELADIDKLNRHLEEGRDIFLKEYGRHINYKKGKKPTKEQEDYARARAISALRTGWDWNWEPKYRLGDGGDIAE